MIGIVIGMLTALAGAAQTPAEIAHQLNTQGNEAADKGNEREAQRLYREAIGMWRGLGAGYEAHVAASMVNLAVSMSNDGQRPAAAEVFEEALKLHRIGLGDTHYRTIWNLNMMAANYLMLGDTERAEVLLKEALPVERRLFPQDIQTAHTLEQLSHLLVRDGKGGEALPLAEEALHIAIHSAGEEGMDAALAYSSVAEAHRCNGSPERALPLYRKARWMFEKEFGAEHPRVAALLSQEGLALMDDGNLGMAEQEMVKSVQFLRKACPACVMELSIAENNLGLLRLRQKHYREADQALTAAIALREKLAAKPGPELASSLENLAFARKKLKMFDEAAKLDSRAQAIRGYR